MTTIFFDLDGTLLDTAPDFLDTVDILRKERDLAPIEVSVLRPAVSHGAAELMRVSFGINAQDPEYPSLLERLLSLYESLLARRTLPFPGIVELLAALDERKISWGIVTNRPSWSTLPLLERLNLIKRAR